jgi:hypothetical protein
MRLFGRLPGWLKSLALLIVALGLFQGVERLITRERPGSLAPRPPDLRRWDLIGCYDLEIGAWNFGRYVASADSATQALLTPPTRVMLLPDSLDEWGRSYGTSRAVPLAGAHDAETVRSLRWFVRADTLWLVWSAGPTRVGVALFAGGAGLVGQAASVRGDSAQGTAAAAAWPVNCATETRERSRLRPRR